MSQNHKEAACKPKTRFTGRCYQGLHCHHPSYAHSVIPNTQLDSFVWPLAMICATKRLFLSTLRSKVISKK